MTTLTWGFESGYGEDSGSSHESIDWSGQLFGPTVELSTEQRHSGTKSLKVTWTGLAFKQFAADVLDLYGNDVTASAWVYVPSGSPAVRLTLGSPLYQSIYATSTAFDAWEHLSVSATAAELYAMGNPYISIMIPSSDSGIAYMDDVVLAGTPTSGGGGGGGGSITPVSLSSLFDGTTAPTLLLTVYTPSGTIGIDTIREITTHRGRSRPDQKYDVGTMTVVVDNLAGDFDPDNTTSLKAGAWGQLIATWEGTDYKLFTGVLEVPVVDVGFTPTVTFTFTEISTLLQQPPTGTGIADALYDVVWDGEPSASPFVITVGSSSLTLSQGRVQRTIFFSPILVDHARVAVSLDANDIDTSGVVPMPPIRRGRSFAEILDECATVEGGRWWFDGAGTFHFKTLADKFTRATKLWLTDTGTETGAIAYDQLSVQSSALYMANQCVVNVVDLSGTYSQYIANYKPSVSDYGIETTTVEACLTDVADAIPLSAYYARLYAVPKSAASSIGFFAHNLGTLYPDLLSMDLGDYVVADRTMPQPDGRAVSWDLCVEAIDFHMTASEFRVTLATSPANDISATIHGG